MRRSTVSSLLEHAVRDDLNNMATRVMAVLNPVKARHHKLSGRIRLRCFGWTTIPRSPKAGTTDAVQP